MKRRQKKTNISLLKKKFYAIIGCGALLIASLFFICFFGKPKRIAVSVVMPVYNTEKYLAQNIRSVLSQTLKDFEFIIVDDASTDRSGKIIDYYAAKDDRIKVYHLPQNSGAAAARNEGIKHIRGEYTLFIDSDDWLQVNALEEAYGHAKKMKADMVMYLANVYDDTNKTFLTSKKEKNKACFNFHHLENRHLNVFSYKNMLDDFLGFTTKYPWNKLIKTSLIKKNNLYFDSSPQHNDTYFITMAMVYSKRIAWIPKELYNYRVNRVDSISHKNHSEAQSIYRAFFKTKQELLLRGFLPELRSSMNKWIRGWQWRMRELSREDPSNRIWENKLEKLIQ